MGHPSSDRQLTSIKVVGKSSRGTTSPAQHRGPNQAEEVGAAVTSAFESWINPLSYQPQLVAGGPPLKAPKVTPESKIHASW